MRHSTLVGDARTLLRSLASESVHCVVTSPPYWGLRDYGLPAAVFDGDSSHEHSFAPGRHGSTCSCGAWLGWLGAEPTPKAYTAHLVDIFREVRRVLRRDGTMWLNVGDSYASSDTKVRNKDSQSGKQAYLKGQNSQCRVDLKAAGLKPKDLVGIPWRLALALQEDGWWLRSDIVWAKTNSKPESVRDRVTLSHEYLFMFTRRASYFFDKLAIMEPASVAPLVRHRRSVWRISTHPYSGQHRATFPPRLVEPCLRAGTSAAGCCEMCGAPYIRILERSSFGDWHPDPQLKRQGVYRNHNTAKWSQGPTQAASRRLLENTARQRVAGGAHDCPFEPPRTIGCKRSCHCTLGGAVPCTVLDLFAGSGTVGLVAEGLKLNSVLIDLDPSMPTQLQEQLERLQLKENTQHATESKRATVVSQAS